MQQALFGGGCFWCTEAVFLRLHGVQQVQSGYAGGVSQNPNYTEVCQGHSLHAEVILIDFDETQISYQNLLDVFFAIHDPTTLNRQGNDIGTQYRSVIFYFNDEQKQFAQQKIAQLVQNGVQVVTELLPKTHFYLAEDEHQNFFARNPQQGYCNFAIPPKLQKLEQYFSDLIKKT